MNNMPQLHDVIELWGLTPDKDKGGNYHPDIKPDKYSYRNWIRQAMWEGAFLWKYCQQADGDMLEIGRSRGGSAALMLAATGGTSRRLTSIDKKSNEVKICLDIISKHKDRYICIVGDSRTATVSHDYGLMFIDGNHKYPNVKLDTERHWGKLHTGGIVVYHDYLSPKWGPEHVGKFVDEWIAAGKAKKLDVCGTSVALEKI
jgi:predicted O-methyltransferase YrrM